MFVHGGPVRQMLLGYHYMQFYHWAYGINQWLASQGYVVHVGELPQRHRLRPFVPHRAQHGRQRQRRIPGRPRARQVPADRDPTSIRTASASGACRTAACSRRRRWRATRTCSRPASISPACTSGAARSIPSSLVQVVGHRRDRRMEVAGAARPRRRRPQRRVPADDRPRAAAARADVYYELIVFPDDTHESMLHSRWMYTLDRMETFFRKFLAGQEDQHRRRVGYWFDDSAGPDRARSATRDSAAAL